MELDDDLRWSGLTGGYRTTYDPRKAIRKIADGDGSAWEELWEELHHQGDVGEASYAALIALVRVHRERAVSDWNTYALAVVIEVARHNPGNPPVPAWLAPEYEVAWRNLELMALNELPRATSDELIHSLIAALAAAKGRLILARMAMLTEDERQLMLDTAGWG
jgi:hypothetical protein